MNNFEKLKVLKPKQGQVDRRTARQRPWTMTEYAVTKSKAHAAKKGRQTDATEKSSTPTPSPDKNESGTSSKTSLASYYTKLDNDFFDLAATELTPGEERLYQRLYRRSWGYQKNTCRVSVLDIAQMVKSDPRHIRRLRDGLVMKGWIKILSSRLESIASKKPLEYRVFSAREILAARNDQRISPRVELVDDNNHRGQNVPGHSDSGQNTRGEIAADLSPQSPQFDETENANLLISEMNSEPPNVLKKEKKERNIPPLNPPKKGEGDLSITPEILIHAEELTETFYTQMKWAQQTERIRQADIASIVGWHCYDGFSFDVIEKAIQEIAKKSDTRSIKRAEFYLAPMSQSASTPRAADAEIRKKAYEDERVLKEERIAKLERIKQKVSEEDFKELFQNQFDELQAENPSIPVFILETLARQKANHVLLHEFSDE